MKLKKIENHYYILSDDEIKEGDWCYNSVYNHLLRIDEKLDCYTYLSGDKKIWFKITHSTQKLEPECSEHIKMCSDFSERKCIYPNCKRKLEHLDINEIEEMLYGYSVEKMALKQYTIILCWGGDIERFQYDCQEPKRKAWIEGFKAAMELNKDKRFTERDMSHAYHEGGNVGALYESLCDYDSHNTEDADEYAKQADKDFYQSLLPKTEWEIEFVNGKIKLI